MGDRKPERRNGRKGAPFRRTSFAQGPKGKERKKGMRWWLKGVIGATLRGWERLLGACEMECRIAVDPSESE